MNFCPFRKQKSPIGAYPDSWIGLSPETSPVNRWLTLLGHIFLVRRVRAWHSNRKEVTGKRFACGIILHDGERVQQTASKLFAMPVKMLWEA